jgi:mRNA degradation ribonuclease J1/J2
LRYKGFSNPKKDKPTKLNLKSIDEKNKNKIQAKSLKIKIKPKDIYKPIIKILKKYFNKKPKKKPTIIW